MPSENSALFSNREFENAGPCPSSFFVYGTQGAAAPHAWEHPVAFARYIRSPKSWVSSFMYGVSPQPAQAPENSRSGCSNWLPFTENLSSGFFFRGRASE